ncbi:hypothetical protein CPC08DRAFT_678185 [Agrocybe pediades]|nr:hypothetical protein CPC08DRAFT_678185 [Agrocybe pediades]
MSTSPGSVEALYHPMPPHQSDMDESQIERVSEPIQLPVDHLPFPMDSRVRWVFFILGCAVLLSWNVVITAMPFFASRLANSPLRSVFGSYLTTAFTAANFIFLGHATATSKHRSPSRQTNSAIVWLTILNLLFTVSTFFTPSPAIFFAFILFNGSVQGTVGAYLQTSVIAVASLFGPLAVQSMMSGQAAVAVAVSGVQVISSAISVYGKPMTYKSDGSAEERSAFLFFALSTMFLVFSLMAHRWLVRTPAYQQVAGSLEKYTKGVNLRAQEDESTGLVTGDEVVVSLSNEKANTFRVARMNIIYEVAVAYVFIVTLAVFPPITTSVQPLSPTIHPLLFSAIHFLVFNLGDFFGRYLCSFRSLLVWSEKRLLTFSLARTMFIPLFLMCNIQRGPISTDAEPIINSDMLFMLLLFLFGTSNGYLCSMCMMSASSLEHNPRLKGRPEDVDVAATVAGFCLVGGLSLGSIASFAVKAIFCRCNPFMD